MNIEELIHDLIEHADKITDQNYRDEGLDVCTAARLLRECLAAGFITDSGEVRKVLGTLSVTADECIIGDGDVTVYILRGDQVVRTWTTATDPRLVGRPLRRECYSTAEAAEAARGEK